MKKFFYMFSLVSLMVTQLHADGKSEIVNLYDMKQCKTSAKSSMYGLGDFFCFAITSR